MNSMMKPFQELKTYGKRMRKVDPWFSPDTSSSSSDLSICAEENCNINPGRKRQSKAGTSSARLPRNAKQRALTRIKLTSTNESDDVEVDDRLEDFFASSGKESTVDARDQRATVSRQSKAGTSSARLPRNAKQSALSRMKLSSTDESNDVEVDDCLDDSIAIHGKESTVDARDQRATVGRSAASSFVRPIPLETFVTDHKNSPNENEGVIKTRPVKCQSNPLDISDAEKLFQECQQDGPLSFEECIPLHKMQSCIKIGEGAFGEVFCMTNNNDEFVALKIIPIEGEPTRNGEMQKKFGEILHEVIVSNLHCAKGLYPEPLLKAWDKFDKRRNSENDRPDFFEQDQLFLILAFEFGGIDLENMQSKLSSLAVAKSILHQVTASLAVAEQALCFEHRSDIKPFFRSSEGLTVSCDISTDEQLFMGQGDYQFEIYRKMREENNTNASVIFPVGFTQDLLVDQDSNQ
ncbi:Serine/threonine-protein kinase haspin [Acipenser ruthenus]|uniref:Serine/threonine-protein kinase haspin n=1 Tax=Acipenser ruthenus TaxID=7906 RepID=A0A444TWP7_ACIRT|nr:Serine/threonine-protein kinase haspin [Acipenser ruthenus]